MCAGKANPDKAFRQGHKAMQLTHRVNVCLLVDTASNQDLRSSPAMPHHPMKSYISPGS